MTDVARRRPEGEMAEDDANNAVGTVDDIDFVPTTEFGRRLLELRRRIIAEQGPLDRDRVEREVAERRCGIATYNEQ